MATKEHTFDISAKLDMQEMKNAITQAQKEVENRYDFKGTPKEIEFNEKAKTVVLLSSSEQKVDAMIDIMIAKMSKREIPLNAIEEIKREDASGGKRKVTFRLVDSIDKEEAKKIIASIKTLKLKVQTVNQGDEIRVSGKNIDDLQAVMRHLRAQEFKAPLVFDNFR